MGAKLKPGYALTDEWKKLFDMCLEKIRKGSVTATDLKKNLKQMEIKINNWAENSEFFDLEKANQLLGWSEALLMDDLDTYKENAKEEILAAILYFVDEDDGIPDNDLLCGLDDDYEVMLYVLNKHNIDLL